MTPAMRADAADALLRLEMAELSGKLAAMAAEDGDKNRESKLVPMMERALTRWRLLLADIESQVEKAEADG